MGRTCPRGPTILPSAHCLREIAMATVLVTWELGGGLGHLLPLEPLVRGLSERGHRVAVALRDLSRAGGQGPEQSNCALLAAISRHQQPLPVESIAVCPKGVKEKCAARSRRGILVWVFGTEFP